MQLIQWVFESGFTFSSGRAETIQAWLFLDLGLRFSINIFGNVTNVLVSYIFSLRDASCAWAVWRQRGLPGEMVAGLRGDRRIVLTWGSHLGAEKTLVLSGTQLGMYLHSQPWCNGRGTRAEFQVLVPSAEVRHSVTVAREPPCIELYWEPVSNLLVFLSCLILLTPLWDCFTILISAV